MNKSLLLLLTFSMLSLRALEKEFKRESKKQEPTEQISQQLFEQCKKSLPQSLQNFLEDFAQWPQEDKDKLQIVGLSFFISGLSHERQAKYEGSVGYWIDCRTQTQRQRECFITCLQYLKQ